MDEFDERFYFFLSWCFGFFCFVLIHFPLVMSSVDYMFFVFSLLIVFVLPVFLFLVFSEKQ